MHEIKTISYFFPHNLGTVNCYLIKTVKGFILIDTGLSIKRNEVENELENYGCKHGDLKLIIITHADADHIGNCVYLQKKFGTKIAINHIEAEAVESGNFFLTRKKRNFRKKIVEGIIIRILASFINIGDPERFIHDIYLDDGFDSFQIRISCKSYTSARAF